MLAFTNESLWPLAFLCQEIFKLLSFLVSSLFRFSISSWVNFSNCIFLGICPFHLSYVFVGRHLFIVFLYNLFYFYKDSSDVPSFTPGLSRLGLLFIYLSIYLSTYLSSIYIYLPTYLSIYHLSIYHLSSYLIYLSIIYHFLSV